MRRRDFVSLIGGSAVVWPLVARARQGERIRLLGVIMPFPMGNSEGQARSAAFRAAAELVTLSPDVILASTTPALAALQPTTRTVPIVFAQVADPVSAGFVASMAQPGANITGFTNI